MTREEREHLTDLWLDAALKQYGEAEPSAGMESRILATLAAKPRSRYPLPVSRFPFASARFPSAARITLFAAAAAVLIAIAGIGVVRLQRSSPSKQVAGVNSSGAVVSTPRPLSSSAAVAAFELAQGESTKRVARKAKQRTGGTATLAAQAPPRRDQFPSPMPLTDEERLLLTYLRITPKEEVLLVAQRQAEREKELQEPSTSTATGSTLRGIE